MKSNIKSLNIIFYTLKRETKFKLSMIVLLMFISSVLEILSIGTVVPLISMIVDPGILSKIEPVYKVFQFFGIEIEEINIQHFLFIFIIIISFATIFKVIVLRESLFISKLITAEIGSKVFEKLIYSSFENLINTRSTSFAGTMTQRIESLSSLLFNFLNVLSAILFFITLFFTMLISGFGIGLIVIFPIIVLYLFLGLYSKKKLDKNSLKLNLLINTRLKTLNHVYNSTRDIILNFAQESYNKIFSNYEYSFRRIEAKVSFISGSARYLIEGVAIITFIIFLLFLIRLEIDNSLILISLGSIVFATQRFLPFFQQMYQSWSNFYGHLDQIKDIAQIINQKSNNNFSNINKKLRPFKNNIIFEKVSYKYPNTQNFIFKDLNIKIKKGDKVVIKGKTGTGKSTLVDLILGLIEPCEGDIFVDDVKLDKKEISSWIQNISHVPQEIFLIDDTIEANIIFPSKESFSSSEINKSCEIAEVLEFAKKKENGVKFTVGENGSNLSGGQKQRIGLARAFIKKRDIIILDEATNQLDKETEKKIFENIKLNFANHTIFAISHNDNNLDFFDKIVDLDQI